MIRVLHITGRMDIGGIETFLMSLYRKIDRTKIQFDFLLSEKTEHYFSDEIRNLGGRIYSVPSRRGGTNILQNKKALNDFFKEHPEYKIVHQHVSSMSYITPVQMARKNRVPIRIIHSHSTQDFGNVLNTILHKKNKPFAYNLATDYFAASTLAADFIFPKNTNKSIKIVNNGINLKKFYYDSNLRKYMRNQYKLKDNEIVIGSVGNFNPSKNHTFMIDVLEKIININPNFKLLLVGSGPLEKELKDKANRLKLGDKIVFAGLQNEVNKFYNAMDCFIFPSFYEGLGISIIEAQATGLPSFASKDRVPEEVAVTNLVEFIPLNNNPEKWAEVIINSTKDIASRRSYTQEISKSGFSIDDIALDLENFYLKKYKTLKEYEEKDVKF